MDRSRRHVTALLAAGLLACAPGGEGDPGARQAAQQVAAGATIAWTPCAEGVACGRLRVPLDYTDVGRGSLDLALKRTRAEGDRIGVLLVNPGGPGASAVSYVEALRRFAGFELRERFDLVAFDPRGAGESAPLDCHGSLQRWMALDPSPDSEAEWLALERGARAFAAECAAAHGTLLPHLGTENVARDMEEVRRALGEETVSFLGLSYGGAIGATYAALYPARVRGMVLDAPSDLGITALDHALAQARGFEAALASYLGWCEGGRDRCAWTSGRPAGAALAAFAARVDAAPLPAPTVDRPLGPGELMRALMYPLYDGARSYPLLSLALSLGVQGDGSALVQLTDRYYGRRADGSYPNGSAVNVAVNCLDRVGATSSEIRAEAARFAREAPTFGVPILSQMLLCAASSLRGRALSLRPPRLGAPVVVIGTTGDPASPYAWAERSAARLEPSVLIVHEASGHAAYGRGSPCVDHAVERYLTRGIVPPPGLRCRPQ